MYDMCHVHVMCVMMDGVFDIGQLLAISGI